ncbi:uncharacterized protein LOC131158696 [Malania oleifera]|uniref:uncharacterized protein LOC131158696 n=1 Tax=Malania oleifera TaxID=397392 RepID=UPI0025AE9525|nr:uncharacterized protein LOC131158696 [Malania oleifera]
MDPIKYVFEKPAVIGRVVLWQMLLTEYDITYVTRKAIKGSVIAEYLADRAVEDYQPVEFDFSDKDINTISQEGEDHEGWTMLFDGTVNVWGHGIGVVLISLEEEHYPVTTKLTFPCTTNIAEEWETWDSKLVPYQEYIQEMIKGFDSINFSHLLRENNLIPDVLATLEALVNLEPGMEIEPIRIRVHSEPTYYAVTEEADGKP